VLVLRLPQITFGGDVNKLEPYVANLDTRVGHDDWFIPKKLCIRRIFLTLFQNAHNSAFFPLKIFALTKIRKVVLINSKKKLVLPHFKKYPL